MIIVLTYKVCIYFRSEFLAYPKIACLLLQNCCNWVSSSEPLDTSVESMLPDCPRVSAGTWLCLQQGSIRVCAQEQLCLFKNAFGSECLLTLLWQDVVESVWLLLFCAAHC